MMGGAISTDSKPWSWHYWEIKDPLRACYLAIFGGGGRLFELSTQALREESSFFGKIALGLICVFSWIPIVGLLILAIILIVQPHSGAAKASLPPRYPRKPRPPLDLQPHRTKIQFALPIICSEDQEKEDGSSKKIPTSPIIERPRKTSLLPPSASSFFHDLGQSPHTRLEPICEESYTGNSQNFFNEP